jgi:nitroimidazol reductase NimA-like FMN-containing flavoprotein (pyridoxamine 5'-phosphate oxidase superfamily)
MIHSDLWDYIQSNPGWMALSTIGKDGFPHTVPIGYFVADGKIYIGCIDNTQKVKNIERNPKVSLMLESGTKMDDIKGVLIKANARIIRRDEDRVYVSRLAALQRGVAKADIPTTAKPGSVYVQATPHKFISWNYGES